MGGGWAWLILGGEGYFCILTTVIRIVTTTIIMVYSAPGLKAEDIQAVVYSSSQGVYRRFLVDLCRAHSGGCLEFYIMG